MLVIDGYHVRMNVILILGESQFLGRIGSNGSYMVVIEHNVEAMGA